jgi:hypothetical protein
VLGVLRHRLTSRYAALLRTAKAVDNKEAPMQDITTDTVIDLTDEGLAKPDRRTLDVLLAALQVEQKDLARLMGYDKGYVTNVFNGHTIARPAFRRAFGDTIASLVLGNYEPPTAERYPAEPLVALLEQRALAASCKRDFYRDLGVNEQITKRSTLDAVLVDRICCQLGLHPTSLYPDYGKEVA